MGNSIQTVLEAYYDFQPLCGPNSDVIMMNYRLLEDQVGEKNYWNTKCLHIRIHLCARLCSPVPSRVRLGGPWWQCTCDPHSVASSLLACLSIYLLCNIRSGPAPTLTSVVPAHLLKAASIPKRIVLGGEKKKIGEREITHVESAFTRIQCLGHFQFLM